MFYIFVLYERVEFNDLDKINTNGHYINFDNTRYKELKQIKLFDHEIYEFLRKELN